MNENAEATPQNTPTMADIAAGVPESQPAGKAESSQATGNTPSNIEEFQSFVADQQSAVKQLQEDLGAVKTEYQELEQQRQREALNKEITEAAGTINDGVGGDAEMAELYLEREYSRNPEFKRIWNNRKSHPEALGKALEILKNEWSAKNQVTADPQVASDQRALMDSQKGGAVPQPESESSKLDNMPDAEFLNYMNRMARS